MEKVESSSLFTRLHRKVPETGPFFVPRQYMPGARQIGRSDGTGGPTGTVSPIMRPKFAIIALPADD